MGKKAAKRLAKKAVANAKRQIDKARQLEDRHPGSRMAERIMKSATESLKYSQSRLDSFTK